MDDITLIGHMVGSGEELAQKLREKGFLDLKNIIEQEPFNLAKQLDITEEDASKIVAAAKAIFKPEVSITGPILAAKEEPEGEKKKIVVPEKIRAGSKTKKEKPIILVKEAMVYKKRKPLIKKYWKVILPIAGLALIGFLLKQRE